MSIGVFILLIREMSSSTADFGANEEPRFSPANAGAHSWMTGTDIAFFNRLAERVGHIGCGRRALQDSVVQMPMNHPGMAACVGLGKQFLFPG